MYKLPKLGGGGGGGGNSGNAWKKNIFSYRRPSLMFDKKKYHHNKEKVQYFKLVWENTIIINKKYNNLDLYGTNTISIKKKYNTLDWYGKKVPSQLCEAALPRRRNKKRIICSIFKTRCYNFRMKQHVLQEFYNSFIAQWPEIYARSNKCRVEKMTLSLSCSILLKC